MNRETFSRRNFIKLGSAGLASATLGGSLACLESPLNDQFTITTDNSLLAGHKLFEGERPATDQKTQFVEEIIVGAGVAGLAAAAVSGRESLIFELGAVAGGSSSAVQYDGFSFSQGAHYDLPYPNNYGPEALAFLEKLDIIQYSDLHNRWDFKDTKYLIDPTKESRTKSDAGYREDPLPKGESYQRFRLAIEGFAGKLPMPTRLIAPSYQTYDRITFLEWLKTVNVTDQAFIQALDYQMRDDYGAPCDTVSALAGLHYYQCRPYYSQELPHFSPPQGNAYFIDKFLDQIPKESLKLRHLVHRIEPQGQRYQVTVLDIENHISRNYYCNRIIYAGHKHGLKYTMPTYANRFEKTRYAPWLAVNLLLREWPEKVYWQNELVGRATPFLGFVNSRAQAGAEQSPRCLLTAYLCLDEVQRKTLLTIDKEPRQWVNLVLKGIHMTLQSRIDHLVETAFIKVHGHAMPIPTTNYLFKDANADLPETLRFAGVDCHRLPLFFEALDSGLQAAQT